MEKTVKSQKNKYKALEIASLIGEYTVVPIPFVIMGIINREEWFAQDGWKVGIGGILAIALMTFATFLVTKNNEKTSKADTGYITLMLGWALGATIFTLLGSIMNQISTIMWVGLSGIGAGFGLDVTRKEMKKRFEKNKLALEEAEKQDLLEKATEERKTVKVKVKK